jgi:hypothetical protein
MAVTHLVNLNVCRRDRLGGRADTVRQCPNLDTALEIASDDRI